jgi:hypothetical protein
MMLRYICDIGLDFLGKRWRYDRWPDGHHLGSIVGLCTLMDVVQMDYAIQMRWGWISNCDRGHKSWSKV